MKLYRTPLSTLLDIVISIVSAMAIYIFYFLSDPRAEGSCSCGNYVFLIDIDIPKQLH